MASATRPIPPNYSDTLGATNALTPNSADIQARKLLGAARKGEKTASPRLVGNGSTAHAGTPVSGGADISGGNV